ncbi:hypothetical protein AKJ16_DCAP11607 [Drosera capensis]
MSQDQRTGHFKLSFVGHGNNARLVMYSVLMINGPCNLKNLSHLHALSSRRSSTRFSILGGWIIQKPDTMEPVEKSMDSSNHTTTPVSSTATTFSLIRSSEIEESSWTVYFEDFICDTEASSSSHCEASSIAFDPGRASSQKKYEGHLAAAGIFVEGNSQRMCCKKRKSERRSVDHDLEDTASSPIRSLKHSEASSRQYLDFCSCDLVNDLSKLYINSIGKGGDDMLGAEHRAEDSMFTSNEKDSKYAYLRQNVEDRK